MILRDPADAGSDKTKLATSWEEILASTIPLKRMGTSEDVADLVNFLASRNSDCG